MNIYSLPSVLAFTVNFSIALIIMLNNPKSKVNRWFFAFIFVFVIWNLSETLILNTSNFNEALLGAQILYRVIFLLPAFYVAIAYNFPKETFKISKEFWFYLLLFAVPISLLALSFPNFQIKIINLSGVKNTYYYTLKYDANELFVVLLAVSISYLIWGTYVLIKKIPHLKTVTYKNQTKLLVSGFNIIIVFFLIINIFRNTIENTVSFYALSTLLTLFISAFFLYVQQEYKIFKTHRFLRSGLTYSFLLTIVLAVYIIVVENLSHVISNYFGVNSFLFSVMVIFMLVLLIRPLERQVELLIDKFFRNDIIHYRRKFSQLNQKIQSYLPTKEFFETALKFCKENFMVEQVEIYIKDGNNKFYNFSHPQKFLDNNFIENHFPYLLRAARAVEYNELVTDSNEGKEKYDIIIPLIFHSEIMALFFLKKKIFAKKITEDEIERLSILGNELAIAYNRNKIIEDLRKKEHEQFRLEKLAAIGQLTAGIAHEIRNPLNTIAVSAETLKRGKINSEEKDELLSYITDEVDRLDKLLKEFLLLSKMKEMNKEKFNIEEFFKKIRIALESKNENDIKISFSIDGNKEIISDFNLLYQVLLNLGLNSLQSIIERCEAEEEFKCNDGELKISADHLDDKIIFKVTDNGMGIPKEKLDSIFNPFYTSKKEGTGLGLSIVHNIISALGGSIDVQSEGRCAQFTITLIEG